MKRGFLITSVLMAVALMADDVPLRTPAQIKQEMSAIRRNTAWDDADAAKIANERIALLADELTEITQRKPPATVTASDLADPSAGGVDPAKVFSLMRGSMAKAVAGGRESEVLLGEKIRDEIVEQYRADVDPAIKCPDVFAEQTTLLIDFSSPAAEPVVAQMEQFRGIKTLILTGGATGAPVDLTDVLTKARGYPLRQLYIVNFRQYVTALPAEIAAFADLQLLAIFGNALPGLPPEVNRIRNVESLLADANPLATVLPAVRSWPKLSRLGVAQTNVTAAELAAIKTLRPSCELLTQ